MIAYRLDYKESDFIDDRFLVLDKIGEGSYGNVYKVQNINDSSVYALKLLRLWEVSDETRKELERKFRQEYETASIQSEYLVHSMPNSFHIIHGNPYFLMEYCPNGDLAKMIGNEIPMITSYARDILMGLHVIHSAGLVHRDLKPDNVLIRANGHTALTDFGIVGDTNNKTPEVGWLGKHIRQALGTPLYMAPEMYERKGGITYLPTIDLWSFGVMMFEMLTNGSFPFGNINDIGDLPAYMKRAKRRDRSYFSSLNNANEGGKWYAIIDKLLEPDQRRRYQSTEEVLHDMQSAFGEHISYHIDGRKSRSQNISALQITQGNDVGRVFILNDLLSYHARMVEVGRSETNKIVLRETGELRYVSRHHFTLEKSHDGLYWIIRDGQWDKNERCWVASTNGTYLNTTAVSPGGMKIFTGDIITVGEYKLKVE